MSISRVFINRPVFTTVIAVVIVLAGLMALRILPVQQYPSIVPPSVTVVAQYPGTSAETVANTVAAPLAQQINGVSDMLYIDSTSSSNGQMIMTVTFGIGTDPEKAQINVNNRVQRALPLLPDVVSRQGVKVQKRSSNILEVVSLYSPHQSYNSTYISNYALVNVINELQRVPGVGQAKLFGAKNYSIRVWMNPEKMSRYDVTPTDISNAIEAQNKQFGAGKLGAAPNPGHNPVVYKITGGQRFHNVKQFKKILLKTLPDGSSLRLKDVARVSLGGQRYAFIGRDKNKPMVPIGIFLEPGANALSTTKAVDKKLDQLAANFPSDMQYRIPYTTTKYIRDSIHEVIVTFIESLILVIAVIFLFLQNWRASLIPVLAIPVSLVGTFGGMYLLGFSINLLTLFGMILAIGLVVDDAIVVIENVERIMSEEKMSARKAALQAMSEVSEPIVAIGLVMIFVFVPVAFLGGFSGQLYRQFAITIAISMTLSAVVALTLSPMLCALLIKRRKKRPVAPFRWFNAGFERIRGGYLRGVDFLMRHAVIGVVLFLVFCAATFIMFEALPGGLVPPEDEGYVLTSTILPPGSSLHRTDQYEQKLVSKLTKQSPVKDVASFSGFNLLAFSESSNAAAAFVVLKDWSKRDETAKQFTNKIMGIGSQLKNGKVIAFNPPPIPGISTTGGFEGYMEATGGQTPKQMEKMANKLVKKANQNPALKNVRTTLKTNFPTYHMQIDRDKARSLGIPISDITQAMQSTFGQFFVNQFTMLNRNYQVNIQSDAKFRSSLDDLDKVYVRAKSGKQVSLSSVVSMQRSQAPNFVTRFNVSPAAKILGDPAPGYSSGEALDAMKKIAKQVLPKNYQLGWTGQAYQEQQIGSASVFAFGFGIIMVFLILAAQYERWSLPLAVLTAVPFALFGASAFVLLRGLNSDVYFQIALLVLIGLAAKNAILIVEYAVQLHKEEKSVLEASHEAARLRFRPIVMTSLAFIMGTLPLAVATGPSSGSRHSIGTAVIGGMLGATILAIFFVPMFYALFTRAQESFAAKRRREDGEDEDEEQDT
jgi:hydrophobe/amphiphile efflux-1 (HAE1) family protein